THFLQMLRNISPIVRVSTRAVTVPVVPDKQAKRKPIGEVLGTAEPKIEEVEAIEEPHKGVLSGVPEEHQQERIARVYKPTREASQQGWNNTKYWRIELDNRGRWDNPLIGWASSGDPLSNVSEFMKFATKEDAIEFCVKNNWSIEVEEPQTRHITPKNYGSIYSWNKRYRVSTK
ncbi:hypothetical protein PMAYCL1PPCAC_06097, partial [Pristionchus mayeri]